MIWRLHRQPRLPTFWSSAGDRLRLRDLFAAAALVAVGSQSMPAADEMANREEPRQVPRLIMLVGVDTPGDPGITPPSAAEKVLAKMLPPRSDSWADWSAPLEPLHRCGEPRALPPCVPPPPCHPSMPPAPFDLVGVQGVPSCGPIYDGPCQPRTGTHDDAPRPHLHRLADRFFDAFYRWK